VSNIPSLKAGDRIHHDNFGKGTVVGPWPDDPSSWAIIFDDESIPKPFPIVPALEPEDFRVIDEE